MNIGAEPAPLGRSGQTKLIRADWLHATSPPERMSAVGVYRDAGTDATERQHLSKPGHGEGPRIRRIGTPPPPLQRLLTSDPMFSDYVRVLSRATSEPHFWAHTPYRLDGLNTSLVIRVTEPLPVYLPAFEGIGRPGA